MLYAEQTATISWLPVEGAAWYQVERVYNDTFIERFTGYSWRLIDLIDFDWDMVDALPYQWWELETLQVDMDFFNTILEHTWQDIETEMPVWGSFLDQALIMQDYTDDPTISLVVYAKDPAQGWSGLDTSCEVQIHRDVNCAYFRVRAFDSHGVPSDWFENTEVFAGKTMSKRYSVITQRTHTLAVNSGESYLVQLDGDRVINFADTYFTLQYNPAELQLMTQNNKFNVQLVDKHGNELADLAISNDTPGAVQFAFPMPRKMYRSWTSAICLAEFWSLSSTSNVMITLLRENIGKGRTL